MLSGGALLLMTSLPRVTDSSSLESSLHWVSSLFFLLSYKHSLTDSYTTLVFLTCLYFSVRTLGACTSIATQYLNAPNLVIKCLTSAFYFPSSFCCYMFSYHSLNGGMVPQ